MNVAFERLKKQCRMAAGRLSFWLLDCGFLSMGFGVLGLPDQGLSSLGLKTWGLGLRV